MACLNAHLHVVADDFSEAQKEAVNAARMWLERLQSWVKQKQEYMAALMGKPNIFASGWAVFVEMTIVQLQDIEQVLPNLIVLACGKVKPLWTRICSSGQYIICALGQKSFSNVSPGVSGRAWYILLFDVD